MPTARLSQSLNTEDPQERKRLLTVAIIGAGASGVKQGYPHLLGDAKDGRRTASGAKSCLNSATANFVVN